jgi:Zn-dependent protease with chaperone function
MNAPRKAISVIQIHRDNGNRESLELVLEKGQAKLYRQNQLLGQHSLELLKFERGGNRNSLIFIIGSGLGPHGLYFADETSPWQTLALFPELASALKPVKPSLVSHGFWGLGLFATSLFALLAILVIYRGPLLGGLGTLIPFAWEQKIGQELFRPTLTAEQQQLTAQMAQAFAELRFPEKQWNERFRFHIKPDAIPNAYASLGGNIFVTRGLISELTSAEELFGVVAHEMIHVERRHVSRSVFQAVGIFLVFQFLLGDVSGIVAVLADQGNSLLNLQYSRTLEEEADAQAFALLVANQINPTGLASALLKLDAYHKKILKDVPGGDYLAKLQKLEWFSSHPEMTKRVDLLEQKYAQLPEPKKFRSPKFDYDAFKKNAKDLF